MQPLCCPCEKCFGVDLQWNSENFHVKEQNLEGSGSFLIACFINPIDSTIDSQLENTCISPATPTVLCAFCIEEEPSQIWYTIVFQIAFLEDPWYLFQLPPDK